MYRVRLLGTGVAGSPWISNLYFQEGTGGTPQEVADACGNFLDLAKAQWMSTVTWQVDPEVVTVDETDGTITAATQVDTDPYVGGTTAGQMLSRASQINIRMSTGFYFLGRQVQGHLYIGGLAASNSTSAGQVSASALTTWTTAAEALFSPAGGVDPVVWSRPRTFGGLPAAGFAVPITAATPQPNFAVLRSRRD